MIRLPSDLAEIVSHGGTVLVPSRQRAHAARLAHAAAQLAAGNRVWATPDILPVETWLIRAVELRASTGGANLPRLLSPAEDWLLWRQCTAEATRDLDLLNRGSLAESLRRASGIAAEYAVDIAKRQNMAGAEAELLYEVQQAVDERCRKLGAASIQSLVKPLSLGGAAHSHARDLDFRGFLDFSPRREELARAFGREIGGAAVSRRVTARKPVSHSAGQPEFDFGPTLAQPRVVIAADELDELEQIARWCRQLIEAQPDARLLVILPGGAGTRERLATLIQQVVDPRAWLHGPLPDVPSEKLVIIEGGGPLAEVPVVAHALTTLAWLGGARGEFGTATEWLRAPYWNSPAAGARARIDLWLRERGQLDVDGKDWVAILNAAPASLAAASHDIARQLDAASTALGAGFASPREWSERFRKALEAVHWPGSRVRGSSEQQTVVRFYELLDEFGQLASAATSLAREDAILWLTELAARTAFRAADDDAAVTISAALADPVVIYDGIWVAGLHAEAFPRPVEPDPFLPLGLQLAAGLPAASAQGRLAEAKALLAAWRAATSELVLSAPARADDLELLPSPLLAQWSATTSESPVTPTWLPALLRRSDQLENFTDVIGIPWPIEQSLPAGTRSLELQNLCGFRAYAELRLGSSELGVPEPGVAPDERGKLLHAALQRLWQRINDSHTLAGHAQPALDALIEQSVAEAADATLGASEAGGRSALHARECRRAVKLIKALCVLELERGPFRVQDTELETTLTLAGARMTLRIDRLDLLESGGRAILDYKSGRRTPADWYAERPSHPQLLAYLAAVGDDVVALATVNVTAREVRFDGVAHSPQLLPKLKGVEAPVGQSGDAWQIRTREWLGLIERLAMDFLAGRAAVDPKPGACEYCQVIDVCRISDRGVEAAAEAVGVGGERADE